MGDVKERKVPTPDRIQVRQRLIRVGCRVAFLEKVKIATRMGRSTCDPATSRPK